MQPSTHDLIISVKVFFLAGISCSVKQEQLKRLQRWSDQTHYRRSSRLWARSPGTTDKPAEVKFYRFTALATSAGLRGERSRLWDVYYVWSVPLWCQSSQGVGIAFHVPLIQAVIGSIIKCYLDRGCYSISQALIHCLDKAN